MGFPGHLCAGELRHRSFQAVSTREVKVKSEADPRASVHRLPQTCPRRRVVLRGDERGDRFLIQITSLYA